MLLKIHSRVGFEEDGHVAGNYYRATAASRSESKGSRGSGARFPNLQKVFRRKPTASFEEETARDVEVSLRCCPSATPSMIVTRCAESTFREASELVSSTDLEGHGVPELAPVHCKWPSRVQRGC